MNQPTFERPPRFQGRMMAAFNSLDCCLVGIRLCSRKRPSFNTTRNPITANKARDFTRGRNSQPVITQAPSH